MFRKPFRIKSQSAMKGSDRFDYCCISAWVAWKPNVDVVFAAYRIRSDETPHRPHLPHRPQIFNILLTHNRTGATVRVYAMNSI